MTTWNDMSDEVGPLWYVTSEASKAEAAWLEDVLAGLMVAGVSQDEIEIRRYAHRLLVEVAVRGEVKYRHEIKFTVSSA